MIISASGIRGIPGQDLTEDLVKKIAIAYGSWVKGEGEEKKVIIGKDTRHSGEALEKIIIEGLIASNCRIINVGTCPTPIILRKKKELKIPAGIIISGSHNLPEWNGLKLLSTKTFLSNSELNEIISKLNKINVEKYKFNKIEQSKYVELLNPITEYVQATLQFLEYKRIKKNNNLRVAIDTGAGAGKLATPQILRRLGCEIKAINNDFNEDNQFPRDPEPVEKNLGDLINLVKNEGYDVGFAHDCDADRLAIIGNDGTCYPEDYGLAIVADYYFKQNSNSGKKMILVTNLASSLMFETLAEIHGAQVVRTPVGERYLAEKMDVLIEEQKSDMKDTIVFGGEGSCGGVMVPAFNNARDGIFAAAQIVQILVETNEKISNLVSKLPKFYSYREKIDVSNKNIGSIIRTLKEKMISEGKDIVQIDMDLRFSKKNDWFVLIHPSNTEPIIRVISEGKSESLARDNCVKTAKLVKSIISKGLK